MENENRRGGARPGAGRPKADDLDDDARCTYERPDGSRCGQHAGERGRCVYHDHGAYRSPSAVATRQQARVDKVLGYPLEPVAVADFPQVAAEYVAAFNLDYSRLRLALEARRGETEADEIEFVREYADLLAQQRATASKVVDLMSAAAKLGIAGSAADLADALAGREWRRVRAGVLAALDVLDEADRLAVVDRLASTDLLDRDACVCCGGAGVV